MMFDEIRLLGFAGLLLGATALILISVAANAHKRGDGRWVRVGLVGLVFLIAGIMQIVAIQTINAQG